MFQRPTNKLPIDIRALYGERITLVPSPTPRRKCCILSINSAVNKDDMDGGERVESNAQLSVRQATALRDALNSFLEGS